MSSSCTHLDSIEITELPEEVAGCEDCLAAGGVWLHLRICLGCGHVGCCDDSPGRHATAHARRRATRSSARWSRARTGAGASSTSSAMRIPQITGTTRIPPSPDARVADAPWS